MEEELEQAINALAAEPGAGKGLRRIYRDRIERAGLLAGLKSAGKVGESSEGLLRTPPGAQPIKEDESAWVEEENAGRRELFRLFAGRDSSGSTPQAVGRSFSSVRAKLAEPGDWVQTPAGNWGKASKGAP